MFIISQNGANAVNMHNVLCIFIVADIGEDYTKKGYDIKIDTGVSNRYMGGYKDKDKAEKIRSEIMGWMQNYNEMSIIMQLPQDDKEEGLICS